MQESMPPPRIGVARSVITLLQQAATAPALQPVGDHQEAIGGILLGKRLSPNRLAIVAASAPGSAPDNRQLGFALDTTQAHATLEEWFTRDPAVDFLGLWHTHPAELAQPTDGDVEIAQKLLVDPAYSTVEVVNLIVQLDQPAPQIRCFYLHRDSAELTTAVSFVPFDVLDHNHPSLLPPEVGEATIPAVSEVAGADSSARTPPVVRWTELRVAALVSLLAVLLLGGVMLVRMQMRRTAGATGNRQQTGPSATRGSVGTAVPAVTAGAAAPTESVATRSPLATAAMTSSTPPTPNATIANPPLPSAAQSEVPALPASAPLPYTLRLEPMDAAYQQGFLQRLRLANCVGCYNIDLIGPVPFREMRINIAGSGGRSLSNYRAPSPMQFPPRPQPYTLQAFDLQGKPLSEPLTFTVAGGTLYVLRITAP